MKLLLFDLDGTLLQSDTLCSRLLAAQDPPIGIYFISEDIFTLASYYREELRDPFFLPEPGWKLLPDDTREVRGATDD